MNPLDTGFLMMALRDICSVTGFRKTVRYTESGKSSFTNVVFHIHSKGVSHSLPLTHHQNMLNKKGRTNRTLLSLVATCIQVPVSSNANE